MAKEPKNTHDEALAPKTDEAAAPTEREGTQGVRDGGTPRQLFGGESAASVSSEHGSQGVRSTGHTTDDSSGQHDDQGGGPPSPPSPFLPGPPVCRNEHHRWHSTPEMFLPAEEIEPEGFGGSGGGMGHQEEEEEHPQLASQEPPGPPGVSTPPRCPRQSDPLHLRSDHPASQLKNSRPTWVSPFDSPTKQQRQSRDGSDSASGSEGLSGSHVKRKTPVRGFVSYGNLADAPTSRQQVAFLHRISAQDSIWLPPSDPRQGAAPLEAPSQQQFPGAAESRRGEAGPSTHGNDDPTAVGGFFSLLGSSMEQWRHRETGAASGAFATRPSMDSRRSYSKSHFGIYPVKEAAGSGRVSEDMWRFEEEEGVKQGVIHPSYSAWYFSWWLITVLAAAMTAVVAPLHAAFYPPLNISAGPSFSIFWILWLLADAILLGDMGISFCLAFEQRGVWVTDRRQIALKYLRGRFLVDLAAVLPFSLAVWGQVGVPMSPDGRLSPAEITWACLIMLRMLRVYRLVDLFSLERFNIDLPFFLSTLIRNYMILVLWSNFAGCFMYFLARVEGFGSEAWEGAEVVGEQCVFADGSSADEAQTWLGGPCDKLASTAGERYVISLYWAVVTLTTVGYGDTSPVTDIEIAWTVIYVLINIGLGAFVLGTITLVMVHNDASVRSYHNKSNQLKNYIEAHRIPEQIASSMEAHLRLNFVNEEASDAHVLAAFPSTLRAKMLRYLYGRCLWRTYLFQGCTTRFLDVLLESARFELFMPQVQMVKRGEKVTELMMLIEGGMRYSVPGHAPEGNNPLAQSFQPDESEQTCLQEGLLPAEDKVVEEGDLFGEIPFFTETPASETVSTVTVCRIMVIPRDAWHAIMQTEVPGARKMLQNLLASSYMASVGNSRDIEELRRAQETARTWTMSFAPDVVPLRAPSRSQTPIGGPSTPKSPSAASSPPDSPSSSTRSQPQPQTTAGASSSPPKSSPFAASPPSSSSSPLRNPRLAVLAPASDPGTPSQRSPLGLLPPAEATSTTAASAAAGPTRLSAARSATLPFKLSSLTVSGEGSQSSRRAKSDNIDGPTSSVIDSAQDMLTRSLSSQESRRTTPTTGPPVLQKPRSRLSTLNISIEDETDFGASFQATPTALSCYTPVELKETHERLLNYVRQQHDNMTAQLMDAAASGDLGCVKQIIAQGFDLDIADCDGRTALFLAVYHGRLEAAKLLLLAGANVNVTTASWGTPLLAACKNRQGEEMIRLLVLHGRASRRPPSLGLLELEAADEMCSAVAEGDRMLLSRLLEVGADPNGRGADGRTALHVAAAIRDLESCRILLSAKSQGDAKDLCGQTPLEAARGGSGRSSISSALLCLFREHGFDR